MKDRGNLFANVEEEFLLADEVRINEIMHNSWIEIWTTMENMGCDNQTIGMFLMFGAMIGVASRDGKLNKKEKELIDDSFGKIGNNDVTIFYETISKKVVDSDYEKLKTMIETFPTVAMSYLKFILSFAYIDGKIEDDNMKKLENAFGIILMADFFLSGQEEVRQPIRRTKIESKSKSISNVKSKSSKQSTANVLIENIISFFEKDDSLITLEDIKKKFPKETKSTIKKELDKLCDEGYLYKVNTFAGDMYGKTNSGQGKKTLKSNNKNTSSIKTKNIDKKKKDELIKKIKEFFEKDDPFMTLEEIKRHFPKETKEVIKENLENLCKTNYLYKVDTIAGNMYGKK